MGCLGLRVAQGLPQVWPSPNAGFLGSDQGSTRVRGVGLRYDSVLPQLYGNATIWVLGTLHKNFSRNRLRIVTVDDLKQPHTILTS